MSDPDPPQDRAAALLLAFPWATHLTKDELVEFAAELDAAPRGWPLAAVQHHAAVVVAYWEHRTQRDRR